MYHSFDTLDVSKSFIKSGMKPEAAEAVARAIATSRDTDLSHIATKAAVAELKVELKADVAVLKTDIAELKAELKSDAIEMESRLEAKISSAESRLTIEIEKLRGDIEKGKNETLKWFIGMNIATISILMAFFKLFIH